MQNRIRRRKRNRPIFIALLIVSLLVGGILMLVDRKLEVVVQEMAEYRSKVIAVQAMTESVEAGLLTVPETNLTALSRNEEGEVVALETDIQAINQLKTEISTQMLQKLQQLAETEMEIPLGTLIGGGIFTGRGPNLSYRFVPQGALNIQTLSRFDSCGINQSRHRIVLSMEAEIGAVTSFRMISVKIPAEFTLSETVLVGTVPESYTQVLTDDRELLSDINDYGASTK